MKSNVEYKEECLARKEIVSWSKELYDSGMVCGSGGNLSIRLADNTIIITPTGSLLGHLVEDELSKTDFEGNLIEGPKPSKELHLHLAVYHVRENINAVAHTHSSYATALASLMAPDDYMPIYLPSFAVKVGNVRNTDYQHPGSKELSNNVKKEIPRSNAVLLSNHGVVAVGKDMQTAVVVAAEVESNAKLFFITNGKARKIQSSNLEFLLGKLVL